MKAIERERVGRLPVWAWATGLSLLVLSLYVITLAPTTAFWDTSEYITTAHILGIPHPPGSPLFVVLGRTWDVLFSWTGLSVAQRINLLSAVSSSVAAGFFFLSLVRVFAHFIEDRRALLVSAAVCVWVGATAFTVWYQSNVNAKVYTISLCVVAVVTYLAMVWEDCAEQSRGDRIVVLVAFLLGLGAANHQMSLLPLLGLGAFVLYRRWRTILRWKLMGLAVVLFLVGYSVQLLFVPIRSAQNPIIDEANPECPHLIDAVTPEWRGGRIGVKCEALDAALSREQYGKPPLTDRQAPFYAQLANYVQYFDWQWARDLGPSTRASVTVAFFLLAMVGLYRHYQGDRDSFVYFATFLLTVTLILVFYLNFKYGYSQYPNIPAEQHEVRERDYFYIVSWYLWGLYAGLGIVTLWQNLARKWQEEGTAGFRKASPVLGLALLPLVLNFGRADRWHLFSSKAPDYSARDWAYNLIQSVEPYGVLFTNGDNDTFPLWYIQEVEGIRKDVTVIVHSYLGTYWYPKQLRDLTKPCPPGVDPSEHPTVIVCQRPFDKKAAVEPYRDMDVTPPTRSILGLKDAEIDRLPPAFVVPQDTSVVFSDEVKTRIRANTVITQPDVLVLYISRQSLGDRPVFFAATAPPVYGRWNLQPHLLREGLAHELVNGLIESTADTVQLSQQFDVTWIDMKRSQQLLWDVYQVDYLLGWSLWPEPSTRASIPAQYYLAYFAEGEAQRLREHPDLAERNYVRGSSLLDLSNRGH